MCGICGVFGYAGRREDFKARVAGMSGLLSHRGPDDSGEYWDEHVGLGHRRLSIIDIEGGKQPMSNEDGSVWIAYNGEVYNFRELRAELAVKGHDFRTGSDTEVIVHLYEEYGDAAIGRLNGMFAFAIWDKTARRLLLARDRVGIKPLYYSEAADGFFFSSELKSLAVGVGGGRSVNERALCRYLLLQYSPSPETMLAGMRKLPPGHLMSVDERGTRLTRYWGPEDASLANSRAGAGDIQRLLEDAVERQLVSDVPLGAFLSGGIDSGAVVALMGRHKEGRVKTFSIGFEGPAAFDERPAARELARILGTEHHETSLSPSDFAELLPKVAAAMDEPVADPAAVPTYRLSALAREHVKVVMTGEGGDELFGGYLRYKLEAAVGGLPGARVAGRALNAAFAYWPGAGRRRMKAARALSSDRWYEAHLNWVSVFLDEELSGLAPGLCDGAWDDAAGWFKSLAPAGDGRLGKMMAADLVSWLPDDLFAKVDRMSMAVSLEARVPYLDYALMDAAVALPVRDRVRGLTTKYTLKRALRGLLPDNVIDRGKKGFDLPVAVWFRGPLRGFLHDMLGGRGAEMHGLDPGYVRRMLDEHDSGRKDWALPLFSVLALKLWSEGMGV